MPRIVADYAAQRRLVGAGHDIISLGMDLTAEVDSVRDRAEQVLYAATHQRTTTATVHVGESLGATLDSIEALYEHPGQMSGVPTGFADLDHVLRGLQPGELYVIGARPSMGKSILALNIAANVALQATLPALLFSLEMSAEELNKRLLSALTQIPHDRFRTGKFTEADWVAITGAVARLANAPLHLNDSSSLTILELKAEARRLQQKVKKLGVIVVDYLQLMTGRRQENRQIEIAEVARGLKQLARELDVPVVAVAQLSRGVESRQDKRPLLSDLRESGEIEQAADVVMFLYRDDYYHPDDSPSKGRAELSIAKHRAGPTATVELAFLGHQMRFATLTNRTG